MKQKLLGNYLLPLLLSVFVALSVGVPTVAFAGNNNVTGNSITSTEPSAQFSSEGSTLVITASGDLTKSSTFSDQLKSSLDNGNYSSVRFAKSESGADITISLDIMKSILSYSGWQTNNSKLNGNSSLIDFSEVGTISGLGAAAVPNDVNYVSVVLPNALSDADAKKIADAQKDANWYWLSDDGTSMNIKGMYPQKYSATASVAMSDKVKSIIVMGPVQWGLTDNVKAFDIAGIDNLDLHTITNSEGYAPTIDPFTTFSGFSNIKRVALCGGTELSTLKEPTDYNSSVQVFQSLPYAKDYAGNATTDHVLQTRVMKQDVLTSLSHFTPEDFKAAVEFVFSGNLSCNDLTFFSGVESKRVNLTNVNLVTSTFTDKTKFEALEGIKNDNIEYLALPNADADTTATLFPTLKENMPNLKGVGYFNGGTFTAQTWTDRGGVCILTAMMQSKLIPSGNTSNVMSIRISGPVNAEDLGKESTTVDANGHLTYKITEANVQDDDVDPLYQKNISTSTDKTDGYVRSHGAFSYANFVSADLSGAEIDENHPNDLCLSLLACYSQCKTIALPRTGKEIPVGCFANFGKLTSLCIPESYECIRSLAFQNVNALRMITTTSGDSIVSLGDSTMVISANMKLIETGAFSNVRRSSTSTAAAMRPRRLSGGLSTPR